MAVGYGFDIHRLVPGRRLVLGGVEIPFSKGLLGHSDGDALLHAVIDALLGAAGLGDIGQKFPDTDSACKDISSEVLLKRVMAEIHPRWIVINVDVTVLAEEPRLAPFREAIRQRLSAALGTDRVSFKAKTMECLGPVGAGEAIECRAVVQLEAVDRGR